MTKHIYFTYKHTSDNNKLYKPILHVHQSSRHSPTSFSQISSVVRLKAVTLKRVHGQSVDPRNRNKVPFASDYSAGSDTSGDVRSLKWDTSEKTIHLHVHLVRSEHTSPPPRNALRTNHIRQGVTPTCLGFSVCSVSRTFVA